PSTFPEFLRRRWPFSPGIRLLERNPRATSRADEQESAACVMPGLKGRGMKEEDGTERQFVSELAELRRQLDELKSAEAERKRMGDALSGSEDRYRDLVEHSRDLICTHDLEGIILSVNE